MENTDFHDIEWMVEEVFGEEPTIEEIKNRELYALNINDVRIIVQTEEDNISKIIAIENTLSSKEMMKKLEIFWKKNN